MNEKAIENGQAGRETTEEYVDMLWTAFNGYKNHPKGVIKEDIIYIIRYCTF